MLRQLRPLPSLLLSLLVLCGSAARQDALAQAAPPRPSPSATTVENVGWRLSRSGAAEGGQTVSMLRTADPGQSDVEVAGLMFRCSESGTDALFIVLSPFGPSAKPTVTVDLGGVRFETQASVLPSGAGLLVPRDMLSLFGAQEKTNADLSFVISEGGRRFSGRIARLYGAPALARLQGECPQKR